VEGFNKWAKEIGVCVPGSNRESRQLYLSPYCRQRMYFDFDSDGRKLSRRVDVLSESALLGSLLALLPSVALDSARAKYSNRR
jgi:hypothetical protein